LELKRKEKQFSSHEKNNPKGKKKRNKTIMIDITTHSKRAVNY